MPEQADYEWSNEFVIDLDEEKLVDYQTLWKTPKTGLVEVDAATITIHDPIDHSDDSKAPDLTVYYKISRMDGVLRSDCSDVCGIVIRAKCIEKNKRAF